MNILSCAGFQLFYANIIFSSVYPVSLPLIFWFRCMMVVYTLTSQSQYIYAHTWIQRMRLQRRQYGIYSVCSIIFMIPCNYKLLFSFPKSVNYPFKDCIPWAVNLESSYLKYFHVVFTVLFLVSNPVSLHNMCFHYMHYTHMYFFLLL